MISINNFSFTYPDGKKAVNNLSLKINEGDLFAFIGHNGAGKTTTIKAIVGILAFNEGDILIDGVSIKDDPFKCKQILAYIPDNPDLYESLTGIQYLNFIADLFGLSATDRKAKIEKYATELDIYKDLGKQISSYSHGMKQKLAFVSAFIHQPKVMIMDEPFVGLDPKAAFQIKQLMHEFCAAGGCVFFSTHVLEVAEKLCNKIAIIKNGELVVTGVMEEITKDASLEDVFLEITDNA